MLKCLSGLTDESLRYFLARVREISSLGDEAALIETDKLIWEVRSEATLAHENDESLDQESAEEELKEIKQELNSLKNKLKRKVQINIWEVEDLRQRLDELGIDWDQNTQGNLVNQIEKIKDEGLALVGEAEEAAHLYIISETLTQPIHNLSSVNNILQKLNDAFVFLEHHNRLTAEINQKIRQSKERAAWFRAKKKLAEAEVAEAGGSYIKAPKLRKEAVVLLGQDWSLAFPDEEPPLMNTSNGN